jgi:hypothetical protein
MIEEKVIEFVFLGNITHNENMLYSIPFSNEVGSAYFNFYECKERISLLREIMRIFYLSCLCFETNMNQIG